jgi:uncharacterized protein (DUF58 family)
MRPNLITQRDTAQAAAGDHDNRVHVSLHHLLRLRHQATGYSFLPRQPIHSILAGRHASRLRGRGLNFEEIRRYLPGDDVRTIDWKVTARTRQPQVRVYTEERDRPMLLVVDQRQHMFFGSCDRLKSVVAAEVAALGAWRSLESGDRVGGIVLGDDTMEAIRPVGGKGNVMQLLNIVVAYNGRLSAGRAHAAAPGRLNVALESVSRLVSHDALIVVISDFEGVDDETKKLTRRLAAHNDILGVMIYDPLRAKPPRAGHAIVTNGSEQVQLDFGARGFADHISADYEDERAARTSFLRKLSAPLLPISTEGDPAAQIRELLGGHT